MSRSLFWTLRAVVLAGLWLALPGAVNGAATTNVPAAETQAKAEDEAAMRETIRTYIQLQEKVQEAQMSIERARQATETAAARSLEEFTVRMQAMEQSIAGNRLKEVEAMQSTTRFMLISLSVFAALGFVAVILTAYFQWRAVTRLAQISSMMPVGRGFDTPPALPALSAGENHLVASGQVEKSDARLQGVIDRLQKRVRELEHTAGEPLTESANTRSGESTVLHASPKAPSEPASDTHNQVMLLLDKGQTLLTQNDAMAAIECFDQVLALESQNTEALVKKGAALEKLRKLEEAIDCYNQAIAADNSMTIAYLYKGGLYNRLERFSEAVECYEQALRTQENRS